MRRKHGICLRKRAVRKELGVAFLRPVQRYRVEVSKAQIGEIRPAAVRENKGLLFRLNHGNAHFHTRARGDAALDHHFEFP